MNTTFTSCFRTLITALSLLIACGVFVHDGRVDRAALSALGTTGAGALGVTFGQRFHDYMDNDGHTHPDHNAARSSLLRAFQYQAPSVPPRENEHRKHAPKYTKYFGRYPFDDRMLPMISSASRSY